MPKNCAAYSCSNNCLNVIGSKYQITFHLFPVTDKLLLEKWLINLKRKNFKPTKYSTLCSVHFDENCFIYNSSNNKRFLKKGAVPTIFCYNQSHSDEERISSVKKSSSNIGNSTTKRTKKFHISKFVSKQSTTVQKYQLIRGKKSKSYHSKESLSEAQTSLCKECPIERSSSFEKMSENHEDKQIGFLSESNPKKSNSSNTKVDCKNYYPFSSSEVDSDHDTIKMMDVCSLSNASESGYNSATKGNGNNNHVPPAKVMIDGESSSNDQNDREDVFGRFVASEMRVLGENPLLYLQTKQAILEILTSANFDLIFPEEDEL